MRSFLAEFGGVIRSHAVFMVMGGHDAQGAIAGIDRLLGKPTRVTTALRQAAVDAGENRVIDEFARRVEARFEKVGARIARKVA